MDRCSWQIFWCPLKLHRESTVHGSHLPPLLAALPTPSAAAAAVASSFPASSLFLRSIRSCFFFFLSIAVSGVINGSCGQVHGVPSRVGTAPEPDDRSRVRGGGAAGLSAASLRPPARRPVLPERRRLGSWLSLRQARPGFLQGMIRLFRLRRCGPRRSVVVKLKVTRRVCES